MAEPVLYQRAPVEAMQWDGTELNKQEIFNWVSQTLTPYDMNSTDFPPDNGVTIDNGGMLYIRQNRQMAGVNNTDYIARHSDGVFDVVYYEHFENDYEQVPS